MADALNNSLDLAEWAVRRFARARECIGLLAMSRSDALRSTLAALLNWSKVVGISFDEQLDAAREEFRASSSNPAAVAGADLLSTLRSELSSAEICRRNGWKVGNMLEGEPTPKDLLLDSEPERLLIRLTAVGNAKIVAVRVGDSGTGEEFWNLRTREWRAVDA
jgi:hypothetical protein